MILILDYGIGNLLSIERAFKKLNQKTKISNSKSDFLEASHLLLPGVGAFNFAMKNIQQRSLVDHIIKFVNSGKPVLGTCLGMQLLLSSSNEFGFNQGLNLFEGEVVSLKLLNKDKQKFRLPHIGWRKIEKNINQNNKLMKNIDNNDEFYYVHSFFCNTKKKEDNLAYCNFYENSFPCIINKKNVFGVQFHPEKSGKSGLKILKNFLDLK